jgi:2-C-methyl-D-erythritol 4-phosphate cytidylyltransferase
VTESRSSPAHWVVIPAAGKGSRFGADIPKQYLPLISPHAPASPAAGRCVLECTLACFADDARIAGIVVAVAADDAHWPRLGISRHARVHTVQGGAERADSVLNALDYLQARNDVAPGDWVLVHDAARPCLSQRALDDLLATLADDPVGGILAIPVSDTVKQAAAGRIDATLDRNTLWLAQTPQMFRVGMLQQALRDALAAGASVTDEASAMEWAGYSPRLVPGEARNLKITRADDLALARYYLGAGTVAGDVQ